VGLGFDLDRFVCRKQPDLVELAVQACCLSADSLFKVLLALRIDWRFSKEE